MEAYQVLLFLVKVDLRGMKTNGWFPTLECFPRHCIQFCILLTTRVIVVLVVELNIKLTPCWSLSAGIGSVWGQRYLLPDGRGMIDNFSSIGGGVTIRVQGYVEDKLPRLISIINLLFLFLSPFSPFFRWSCQFPSINKYNYDKNKWYYMPIPVKVDNGCQSVHTYYW